MSTIRIQGLKYIISGLLYLKNYFTTRRFTVNWNIFSLTYLLSMYSITGLTVWGRLRMGWRDWCTQIRGTWRLASFLFYHPPLSETVTLVGNWLLPWGCVIIHRYICSPSLLSVYQARLRISDCLGNVPLHVMCCEKLGKRRCEWPPGNRAREVVQRRDGRNEGGGVGNEMCFWQNGAVIERQEQVLETHQNGLEIDCLLCSLTVMCCMVVVVVEVVLLLLRLYCQIFVLTSFFFFFISVW